MKRTFKIIALSCLFIFSSFAFAQSGKPDALKLYQQGNYAQSIKVCESELLSNPNNLDSYAVMCWSLIENRQYAEAEQRASEARKINAYDVRIIEVLAEAKYYLGKNNEALNLFQTYVANVPENGSRYGKAYYYMGEIYIRQARFLHADIALTTAVRSEPLLDYWWTRLGYARENTKDYVSAIAAYDKALSLNSAQADAKAGKTRCQSHL